MSARPTVSPAAERVYARLSAYADGDEQQGWLLLHLCEALARQRRNALELLGHDLEGSGRRRSNDPARAPEFYLPRLRDLYGNEDDGLTGDALRLAIERRPRARRSQPTTLLADILATLTTPDATVRITERTGVTQAAYAFRVRTFAAQTPDPARTRAAARQHKHLWVRLDYECLPGQSWRELRGSTSWRQLRAKNATWGDLAASGATWDNARASRTWREVRADYASWEAARAVVPAI